MERFAIRVRADLSRWLLAAALVVLLGLGAGPGARLAFAMLAPADDGPVAGVSIDRLTVAQTKRAVTRESLMGEGRFSELLYLYGMTFSPDSRWLAFVLDAIPKDRRAHQYYVYVVDPTDNRREMVLETSAGSEIECSFAWTGADTPVLASPTLSEDVVRPVAVDGPPWQRAVRIKGVDPRPRPHRGGVAFRRRLGEHLASVWFLGPEPSATPTEICSHASVFGEMAWASDGSRLAFMSPEGVEMGEALWTIVPGEDPVLISELPVTDFAWSPDGTSLAAKLEDGTLEVLSAEDGALRCSVEGARTYVWSPDSSGLAYAVPDDTTGVERLAYMPAEGGLERTLCHSRSAGGWDFGQPRFSPDGSVVYSCSAAGVDVTGDGQVYDKADRSLFRCDIAADTAEPVQATGSVPRLVTSPDGRYAVLVVESPAGTRLAALDLATGATRELGAAPVERYAYQLAWSADARWVAIEDDLSLGFARLGLLPAAAAREEPAPAQP